MGNNNEEKKSGWWNLPWVIIALILIAIVWMFWPDSGKEKESQKASLLTEQRVALLIEQNSTKDVENARLQKEVNSLNAIICDLKNQLAAKSNTSSQKPQQVNIKITTESTTPSSAPTVTASSYSKVAPVAAKPVVSKAVQEDQPVVSADLSDLFEGGKISFCVMVNGNTGLHFPQLALDRGVKFSSLESNPSSDGHNWIVVPVDRIEGDCGLRKDGTFFVSADMLAEVLSKDGTALTKVEIKTKITGWTPKDMTRENGYYIYHTR